MEKILKFLRYFLRLFFVHFLISLFLNGVFDEREAIVKTIIASVLFVVIYSVLVHFISKFTKEN